MKIAIANDHSAVELKNIIKEHLESKGYDCALSAIEMVNLLEQIS